MRTLYLPWIVVLIGTLGSLDFSEIMHLSICHLCWYQRMCLYPLVVILGMAAYREDKTIIPYACALSLIGGLIALYQYGTQKIPFLHALPSCSSGGACNEIHVEFLGFITLPLISFVGFAVLTACLFIVKRK